MQNDMKQMTFPIANNPTKYKWKALCLECQWEQRFKNRRQAIAETISHITWQHRSNGQDQLLEQVYDILKDGRVSRASHQSCSTG